MVQAEKEPRQRCQTKSYIASMKCRAQCKRRAASVAARRATECRPACAARAATGLTSHGIYSRDRFSHEVPSAGKLGGINALRQIGSIPVSTHLRTLGRPLGSANGERRLMVVSGRRDHAPVFRRCSIHRHQIRAADRSRVEKVSR